MEEKARKQTVCTVTQADLPLSCPMAITPVWNQHPRVYLPIAQSKEARCPYCGTLYVLEETRSEST